MRILYVTAELPWPLTSGYLRHYHFIRALSEHHRITLLSLIGPRPTVRRMSPPSIRTWKTSSPNGPPVARDRLATS